MDYTGYLGENTALCIFDLDGTLVDSLEDLFLSVNWALGEYGYPEIDRETVRRCVGKGARNLLVRAFAAAAEKGCLPSFPDEAVTEALARYRAHYDAHCTDHTCLYPGIREWLEYLSARSCAMAVLTNKPENATVLLLRFLGIDRFFGVVAGPETFGALKPDPAGILSIMERCGASPGRTVMIGDSVVDVLTGRNAGTAVCGITGGLGNDDELRAAKPDILIQRSNK